MSLASQQSTLDRFRRVARNHRLPEALNQADAPREIEWLRSKLNGKVYRNAESWMVPSWALKDSRRSTRSSSDSDSLDNDQRRNWTTIGGVGSSGYGVCDSKGLLTVIPECGSIDFWLLGPMGIIFPSTVPDEGPRLVLVSAEDQVYEWKTDLGPLEFSRLVYHGSREGNEAIYNEVQVRNRSLERAKLTFYVAIRPMSFNGVEPIEESEFSPPKRVVYTNGLVAMIMNRDPKSVYFSTADSTDIPSTITALAPRIDTQFNAPNGLGTVVLRFDVLLKPAGTERFFFASPLSPLTRKDPIPAFPMDQRARDSTVQMWFEFMDSTLSAELPDRDLNQVLSQSKAVLAMQIHRSLLTLGTDVMDMSWAQKAALISALCRCNCLSLAEEISLEIIRGTRTESLTDPSAAGPALWSILQVFEYTQNASYLTEVRRFIDELLPVVTKRAQSYLSPTLPSTPAEYAHQAHEVEESVDIVGSEVPQAIPVPRLRRPSEFSEAVWVLEALRSVVGVYEHTGEGEQLKVLTALLSESVTSVQNQSKDLAEELSRRDPKETLPEAEVLDSVTLLGTVALLKTRSIDAQLLDRIQQEIAQKWTTILRMVRLPNITREHSIHLTLVLAHYCAFTKNRAESAALLRSVLKFISEFHVLPDWVDPKTGGGSHGSGCSLLAAMDLLLLMRDMIVNEDGDDLTVLPGIPQDWYTSNNILVLRNAPTLKGMVQIEMGASANQRQVEVRMQSLPREIDAYLPNARAVSMAKIYGGGLAARFASSSSPHIRVVPLWEDVVLAFLR